MAAGTQCFGLPANAVDKPQKTSAAATPQASAVVIAPRCQERASALTGLAPTMSAAKAKTPAAGAEGSRSIRELSALARKSCVCFVLALGLGGCAHLPPNALAVPVVEQQTDYSCGPATLMAILRYWQRPVASEQELYPALHTTVKDGTEPFMIEAVARAHGLHAEYRIGATVDDLRAALAAGTTVIVDLQAWRDTPHPWRNDWDDGHYIVLVAIDGDRLYAMDPSADDGYSWLTLGELEERWHDFEMRDGKRRNLQHMAVFISGDAHGSSGARVRGARAEKLR
jgi:predicted double-glycine peptidase